MTEFGEVKSNTPFGEIVGLNTDTAIRRGKSIVATEESRTNTAYGLLTTPDQVEDIVVPTDGLLFVQYSALVKASVIGAGRAAIFLGATQLKTVSPVGGGPSSQEANFPGIAAFYIPIFTRQGDQNEAGAGLYLRDNTGSGSDSSSVATGLAWGQAIAIEVDPGTYDISVQFRATSGSVSAKERKLRVWTAGF